MKDYQYAIILYPDREEGGYTVTVLVLPGVVAQGETIEEAIAMAKAHPGFFMRSRPPLR